MTVNTKKAAAKLMRNPDISSVWAYTNLGHGGMRGKTQYAAFTDEKWNDIHQAPNVCDPVCLKNEYGLTERGKDFINILIRSRQNEPLVPRAMSKATRKKLEERQAMYPISKETKKFNEEKYDR